MARWSLRLSLDAESALPVYLQIARGIADAVRCGRLRPGARLPGTRRLAAELAVHRNTVVAAYDELIAQSWAEAHHGRGTFVTTEVSASATTPARAQRSAPAARAPGFALRGAQPSSVDRADSRDDRIQLAGGVPDTRLIPADALARAYRRAIRGRRGALLGYGDPEGEPRLRAALADMLTATRGLTATAEDVITTRGSQMAIWLAARAILAPGDVVAVEALGYRQAWDALRLAGACVVPVAVDERGLRVDRLAALCQKRRVRAVYVTPHHQYPTLATLAPGRRLELLALARRTGFAILEDDYDNEFHYAGRPVLPLGAGDRDGVVVYIGTLSKILAPALRIGYTVASRALLQRMVAIRGAVDRQGDRAGEVAVAELLEDGELQRHARKMRAVYAARREALAASLRSHLGDELEVALPRGGMAIWCPVARGIDVDAWADGCAARGVAVGAGRSYAFDGRYRAALRLGFSAADESEITRGVAEMARAVPASRGKRVKR